MNLQSHHWRKRREYFADRVLAPQRNDREFVGPGSEGTPGRPTFEEPSGRNELAWFCEDEGHLRCIRPGAHHLHDAGDQEAHEVTRVVSTKQRIVLTNADNSRLLDKGLHCASRQRETDLVK